MGSSISRVCFYAQVPLNLSMVNGSETLNPSKNPDSLMEVLPQQYQSQRMPCIKRYGYGHHLSSMPQWCGINCSCFSRLSYHYVCLESSRNPMQQWPLLFSKHSYLVSCELHHREPDHDALFLGEWCFLLLSGQFGTTGIKWSLRIDTPIQIQQKR